jgi:hypothetical protein
MTLYPIIFHCFNRDYYRDTKYKQLYCKDIDGTWYFCSKDGEPDSRLTEEEINIIIIE